MSPYQNDSVSIERGSVVHLELWAPLRARLWPSHSIKQHSDELRKLLGETPGNSFGFLAILPNGGSAGFAEASLRRDYVNGCSSSPVLFFEGVYVEPDYRRQNVGRALFQAVKAFGTSAGCTEFASDAALGNVESHLFHAALGFEKTERVVFFRQSL